MPENPYQLRASHWFQFRLRTLFVVVAAAAFIGAQWPFFQEADYGLTTLGQTNAQGLTTVVIYESAYELAPRVVYAIAAEVMVAVAWLAWRYRRGRTAG